MNPEYSYADVPLTGAVFAKIALDLIEPKTVAKRKELIDLIESHHLKNGGLPARGSLISVGKKGLQILQRDGLVEPTSVPGFWRFGTLAPRAKDGAALPEGEPELIEFGEGGEIVYAYYFPAYRDQAAHLGRAQWPIKVGMTTSEVTPRMQDQIGTAMPERPRLAMIYRTDDARDIERLVHSTLRARKRKVVDSPGTEWFLTSVSEIREIINFSGLAGRS